MSTVTTTREGDILTITLNRPEHGNSINMALAEDLLSAAQSAANDATVRCVVLAASGRMFCVGGDITEFSSAGDQAGPFICKLADKLHEGVLVLSRMAKPLVALIQGPAAGAGLSLAAAADIVIASEAAHFTAAYTAIGLTPDGGMSWMLPRLVGLRLTQEMMLTNRRLSADEAAAAGLVTRVVDASALTDEGNKVAAQMADGPTAAFGSVRRLLAQGQNTPLDLQLDREAESIATAAGGPEGREGVAAFKGRRKANFRNA